MIEKSSFSVSFRLRKSFRRSILVELSEGPLSERFFAELEG